jgi:ribose-phosphate pyrophosphokinase
MICIRDKKIDVNHFPDGTQMLLDWYTLNWPKDMCGDYRIIWHYENDAEMVTLYYLVNHLKRNGAMSDKIHLYLPYIPNARMDRTHSFKEVFTLKYFAEFINQLNFKTVTVLDPHSDVSTALINNVVVETPDEYIEKTLITIKYQNHISDEDLVIYFPDNGAYKRYKDMKVLKPYKKMYGQKVRDWDTGEIKGLDIIHEDGTKLGSTETKDGVLSLSSKYVLMIDDIISYGGTFYYSALKLNEFKPAGIYAYATHTEPNSLWNEEKGTFIKVLKNGIVKKLYTTTSIYNINGNDFVNPIPVKKQ